jgi:hypothetical protein
MKIHLLSAILIVTMLTIAAGNGSNSPRPNGSVQPSLVASDGGPIPCPLNQPNCDGSKPPLFRQIASDGGPIPTCRPGDPNCKPDDDDTLLLQIASDGGPIPTCRPGTPCKPDDDLREIASDGGPIPTCRPGNPNCKPDDDDTLRQTASDGGPIPTCRPGTPCTPDDDLLLRALNADYARSARLSV